MVYFYLFRLPVVIIRILKFFSKDIFILIFPRNVIDVVTMMNKNLILTKFFKVIIPNMELLWWGEGCELRVLPSPDRCSTI
jgi:hypothetical protein